MVFLLIFFCSTFIDAQQRQQQQEYIQLWLVYFRLFDIVKHFNCYHCQTKYGFLYQ